MKILENCSKNYNICSKSLTLCSIFNTKRSIIARLKSKWWMWMGLWREWGCVELTSRKRAADVADVFREVVFV